MHERLRSGQGMLRASAGPGCPDVDLSHLLSARCMRKPIRELFEGVLKRFVSLSSFGNNFIGAT